MTQGAENNRQTAPMVKREEFAGTAITTTGETAGAVVAAQATAEIQARYVMAMKNPRDLDDVRLKMLKECRRPSFAKVAIYRKPIGAGIEGPSIRFAEAAIRCMGNIAIDTIVVFDDPYKRILRIAVVDIENNVPYSTEITVEKTVERKNPKAGTMVLGTRENSNGQLVYLVPATEDELLNKINALVSKAIRTNGMRHIPGDIVDECKALIYEIRDKEDAQDPDAARKKLADSFAELGVMPSGLKEYLDHDFATSTPAEMKELRGVYALLRDGDMNWTEVLDAKRATRTTDENGEPTAKGTDKVKEKLKAKEKAAAEKAASKPTAEKTDKPEEPAGSEDRPDIQ
jgi:hypothetical protein